MKGQRGEGLISVLISVAILGILVVTLVTLYQMYGVMMNKSLLRREADNLIFKIRGQISRRVLCQASLAGNTWDGLADAADQPAETDIVVRDMSGVIAQTGMTLANGQLTMDRVFIRRFQIDTNADNTRENVEANAPAKMGETDMRAQGGEIVVRFRMTGAAASNGSISERRAAVLVIVDPAAPYTIRDCDINEESTHPKICNAPEDARDDGFGCPPTPPHPECDPIVFIGSVDATGESKCHCIYTCPLPYYQNVRSSGTCTGTSVVTGPPCPVETTATPPDKGYCRGKVGSECYFKVFAPGTCGPALPWLLKQATCLLPGS